MPKRIYSISISLLSLTLGCIYFTFKKGYDLVRLIKPNPYDSFGLIELIRKHHENSSGDSLFNEGGDDYLNVKFQKSNIEVEWHRFLTGNTSVERLLDEKEYVIVKKINVNMVTWSQIMSTNGDLSRLAKRVMNLHFDNLKNLGKSLA